MFWRSANSLLREKLQVLGRSAKQIKLDDAARIPRPSGGDVWELEAWIDGRFLRLWSGEGPNSFLAVSDGGDDEKSVRYINPIGAMWIDDASSEGELLVLARYSFWDGGEFAIFRITNDGAEPLVTAAAAGC
jgi:hypothetical protein